MANNTCHTDPFPPLHAVMGCIGVVLCTVAVIIVLVSRFYKDIVQRLIVYELITVLVYSLSTILILYMYIEAVYNDGINEKLYSTLMILAPTIGSIFYCANSVLTLWLTLILYLCIVHLKELKNFKKLEPVAIITSCIPFLFIASIFQLTYDKECDLELMKTSEKSSLTVLYSIVGLLSIIISILMIIIIIKVLTRSFRRQRNDYQAESPLLTNQNKWRTLSKQLLPLVVYPIVNTTGNVIFVTIYYISWNERVLFSLIVTSLSPITSTLVILHLCLLKCKECKKKRREMKKKKGQQGLPECTYSEAIINNEIHTVNESSDVFTSYTIASTNARTEYHYDRGSTITESLP